MDVPFLILHVEPPSGDLVNICPVHGFFVADNSVKARFGELPSAVTLMVFQFCKRFEKRNLQLFARESLLRLIDNSPGHPEEGWCEPLRTTAVPLDLVAVYETRD